MLSSGMLRRVALERTDVSEERIASMIRVKISVLPLPVTANLVPNSLILFILMMKATRSFETSVLTRATRHHIPKDGIIHSQRRDNLKYYMSDVNSKHAKMYSSVNGIVSRLKTRSQ
jgi:hypothetical protein